MSQSTFFATQSSASRVKAEIVSKYFPIYARIIAPRARSMRLPVGYVDFFAGQGRYDNGAESTPLMILRTAIDDAHLRDVVHAKFNDADPDTADKLEQAIARLPLDRLKYHPVVHRDTVGRDTAARLLSEMHPPTLFFVDPFGYRGLSRALMQGAVRHWGCEIVFFFNFGRVNRDIANDCVSQHIDDLFGDDADELRRQVADLRGHDREQAVIDKLVKVAGGDHGFYVRTFAFKRGESDRTSHYLVHVTKHVRGHEKMTEIMGGASSYSVDGVPVFAHGTKRASLLDVLSPMDRLKDELSTEFAGQSLTFGAVWARHFPGKNYIRANYRDAILQLETEQRVTVTGTPGRKRRARTLPGWAVVIFPTTPGTTANATGARSLFD